MAGRTLRQRIASAPPEQIADGVWVMRGGFKRTMNVVLIREPDGVTAYDAGEKGMADEILRFAAMMGGLKRVVLGHADNDHRGAAPMLGVPVYCHAAEAEHARVAGRRDYWRQDELPLSVRTVQGFLMDHAWDGGPVEIAGTLAEGDTVGEFRVIELPGHAPGLIGLFRDRDRLALVSDLFYMTDMWGRPQPPAVPLDPYNQNTAHARESIRKLAALYPEVVMPGHLGPLTGPDVHAELLRAAAR